MIKTRFIVAIGLLMTLACCSNSGTDQTPDPNPPTPPTPPATGDYVSVQNGKIYAPNGGELSLWGVNFQPCLSWEYNDRLKRHGIPQTAEALRRVAHNNLEEVIQTQSFGHPLPPDTRRFHRCGGQPGRNALPGRAGLHGRRSCRTGHLHYAGPYQPHGQRLRAQFGIHDRRPPGVGTRQGGRPEIEKLRPPAAHAQKQLFGDDLCGRETHRPVGADQRTRSLQLYGHTVQPRRLRRFPVLGGRQRAAGQRRFVCGFPCRNSSGIISTACTTSSGRPGRSSPSSGATTGTVTATATRIFSKAPSPRRPKPWPAATIRGRISCRRTTGAIPKTSRRRIIRAGSTSISTT